jgi:TetR/AcrR family transcriptional repressor of nem operon
MPRDGTATRERILEAAGRIALDRGFAAVSLDDILADAGVTKGAFFHHFPSKADLGMAILERYARADIATLDRLWDQSQRLSRDPLQQLLLFVGLFAEEITELAGDDPGCLYATFVYERQLGRDAPRAIVEASVRVWRERIRRQLEIVADRYPPQLPVDLDALADLVFTTSEGAYVVARATGELHVLRDQVLQVRNYLELLFAPASPAAGSRDPATPPAAADARPRPEPG